MVFRPFEVSIPHIFYAVLGGFIVLFGMFSLLIREKLYIGEAPLAFVFGVIIGPYGANIVDPRSWGGGHNETVNEITLEVTRVILAVGVFAIGVELPKAYMAKHWKSLFFLLAPVMTWGWLVSAGLIYALIPGLSFLSSLAVAACLTPTDPILAAAVVGGKYADKHVPAHLRHLLAAESGCNDGAAFPFLYLAIYLVTESSDRHAIQDWFLITWFYEVILGVVFGAVLGIAFRHLMKFCERNDLIDRQSYVAQYVSLALFTIGVLTLLGSDDLLAAFSCGTAFAWDGFFNRQTEQSVFSSVIDLLFNIAAFIFIGAWMPFNTFSNAELTLSVWRLIVIAILVLLLRRLPIILLLYKWIPDIKTFREAIFSGHFGPIGVGAVFISTLAVGVLPATEGNPEEDQIAMLASTIQPIVSFMVLCSITIHGLSIPFFSLGRRVHSVSRTWSRHQSMDPGTPEWATNVRRVHRPEDIIINRDSILERGELRPDRYEEKIPMTDQEQSGEDSMQKSETSSEARSSMPIAQRAAPAAPSSKPPTATEARPDTPPDGEELDTTWKEGKDIVVEHRQAPGEEVEVEVVRGAAAPEEGVDGKREVLKTIRGSPGEVEQSVKAMTEKLRGKARVRRKELEETVDEAKDAVARAEESVLDEVTRRIEADHNRRHTASASSSARPSRSTSMNEGDEDEEGWASDRSGANYSRQPSGSDNSDNVSPKRSSKTSKTKVSSKPNAALGSRRQRHSIRRGLLARVKHQASSSPRVPSISIEPESEEIDDDEEKRSRSRSRGHQRTASGTELPGAASRGPTHSRVESLRGSLSRSESRASSIRSVHFVSRNSQLSRDERDSPTSPLSPRQVNFELPADPRQN